MAVNIRFSGDAELAKYASTELQEYLYHQFHVNDMFELGYPADAYLMFRIRYSEAQVVTLAHSIQNWLSSFQTKMSPNGEKLHLDIYSEEGQSIQLSLPGQSNIEPVIEQLLRGHDGGPK